MPQTQAGGTSTNRRLELKHRTGVGRTTRCRRSIQSSIGPENDLRSGCTTVSKMELIQVRQSPDGIHELEPENVSAVTASTVFGCSIQIATLIDRHSGIGVGTVISVREGVQHSVGLGLSG